MSEEASEPNKPVEKKKGKGKLVGILVALALILGAGAAGAVLAPKYLGGGAKAAAKPAEGAEEEAEHGSEKGDEEAASEEEEKPAEEKPAAAPPQAEEGPELSPQAQSKRGGVLRLVSATSAHEEPAAEAPKKEAEKPAASEAPAAEVEAPPAEKAERDRAPGIAASVTKLATTWLNHALAETALDLLCPTGTLAHRSRRVAGRGFWPHEFMFSLGMILGGGTTQIQRNVIAQRGLGLSRGA